MSHVYPTKTDLIADFSIFTQREFRDVLRREVKRKAKFYARLAQKHPADTEKHKRFLSLAYMYAEVLAAVANEAAPKQRAAPRKAPLRYPQFPDHLPLRLHFLAQGSLRRQRAVALSANAPAKSRQRASTGEEYVSVALGQNDVLLFERLVETLGDGGLRIPDSRTGGLSCHDGTRLSQAACRIADDNTHARTYSQRIRSHSNTKATGGTSKDVLWDPDPVYRNVLEMTQADALDAALRAIDTIAPAKREVLFDEVIYLKFCTRTLIKAQDLRYIARKYIRRSAMRKRLATQFEQFLCVLDRYLPSWSDLHDRYPWNAIVPWYEFKTRASRSLATFGHPIGPRGRFLVWNPDIYSARAKSIDDAFEPGLRAAENEFRRIERVPQIGRQWRAESALFDLVLARFSDAISQWSPWWLGRQSVDIYVPSLNMAFEYQGEQHFRAIAFFGGEEGLKLTMQRDRQKRTRFARKGIVLTEWRYDRAINDEQLDLILKRRAICVGT